MTAPLERTLQATLPALGAAVAGDQVVGEALFAGTVTSVSYTPEAAITGDNTNTRTMTLVNKGQSGSGSTVIATLAFTTGNNAAAVDEKQFVMSVVANATTVAAEDVLVAVETVAGTGLATPGGRVEVVLSRS